MTRPISTLARVVARTASIGRAGDKVATRIAASLERCPSIVSGVIVLCDACRRGERAACIGDAPARDPWAGLGSDGPSLVAIFGRGQP